MTNPSCRCAHSKEHGTLAGPQLGDTLANAAPRFADSVLTCPVYEFVTVRSRRALVTACPYPSLLK
jgi:hypothetical protein